MQKQIPKISGLSTAWFFFFLRHILHKILDVKSEKFTFLILTFTNILVPHGFFTYLTRTKLNSLQKK